MSVDTEQEKGPLKMRCSDKDMWGGTEATVNSVKRYRAPKIYRAWK